jgi:hypothetical protein
VVAIVAGATTLAVDAAHIYIGNPTDHTIRTASTTAFGSSFFAQTTADPTSDSPVAIATASRYLFWSGAMGGGIDLLYGGSIASIGNGGGPWGTAESIASDGVDVFGTEAGGGLYEYSVNHGGQLNVLCETHVNAAASDGTTVFFIGNGGTSFFGPEYLGAVAKSSSNTCPSNETANIRMIYAGADLPIVNRPRQMVVGGSNVYWIDASSTSRIVQCPKMGGSPTTLAEGQAHPMSIAADARGVYWTNDGDGTVMRLAPGDTAPVPIAHGRNHPSVIVIDPLRVYWLEADGSVVVLAR